MRARRWYRREPVSPLLAGIYAPGPVVSPAYSLSSVLEQEDADEFAAGPLSVAWTAAVDGRTDQDAQTLCLVVGRVRNLDALARELDVEQVGLLGLLLAAFAHWGEDALGRLRGSFVLALWENATRTGLLAVDQLGAGSLFLHASSGRLAFASEIRHLTRLLSQRPSPDRTAVVHWLAGGYLERGRTLLEGVRRLEGGQFVRLEDGAWRTERYWTPRYSRPLHATRGELATELTSAIEEAVAQRVAENGSTGVLLSGGLDSSTVASFARRFCAPESGLFAYSAVFPDRRAIDESGLIEHVTTELGIPGKRVVVHGGSMLAGALEFLRAWGAPSLSPTLAFNLPLLRLAARSGACVVLDGEGGDELFGCSPYLVADHLRRANIVKAEVLARRLPGVGEHPSVRLTARLIDKYGVRGVIPYGLHKAVRRARGRARYAPKWLLDESARLYVETHDPWAWKSLPGPRWWAFLADQLTGWRERLGVHDYLRRRAALVGVEVEHPFLDDLDLVELVLRLPPELAFDPYLDRPFLRECVRGAIPETVRLRRDKSDFSPLFVEALSGPDRLAISALLGAEAEVLAFVKSEHIKVLLDTPEESRNGPWAWRLWTLVMIECWLRSQADQAFPDRALEMLNLPAVRYEIKLSE